MVLAWVELLATVTMTTTMMNLQLVRLYTCCDFFAMHILLNFLSVLSKLFIEMFQHFYEFRSCFVF